MQWLRPAAGPVRAAQARRISPHVDVIVHQNAAAVSAILPKPFSTRIAQRRAWNIKWSEDGGPWQVGRTDPRGGESSGERRMSMVAVRDWAAAWLNGHGPRLRFCVRMTAAALLAFALARVVTIPLHGLWAVLTAVVVTQLSIGGSL